MLSISKSKIFIILALFVAFFAAVTQPFGFSPDYTQYELFFREIRVDFLNVMRESRFEPGFSIAAAGISRLIGSDVLVYGIFVFSSMAYKLCYTRKMSSGSYLYLAIIFYFFRFFPLHELNQLRAALAISLIFAACFYVWTARAWVGGAACVLAATFHYSSLIISPFLFLPKIGRLKSVILALSVFFALYLASNFAIEFAQKFFLVFETYDDNGFGERAINPLSPVLFPEFFLLVAALVFWGEMTDKMQKIVTIQLMGVAIFYALIDFHVVAVRSREFFSVLRTLFIAQAAGCSNRLKFYIYIFVVLSMALSVYQYLFLDFFHK